MTSNEKLNAHMAQGISAGVVTKEYKMRHALMVIILSPSTRAWLAENDPKALQQCREALDLDNLIARTCNSISEAEDFAALYTNTIDKL